MIKCFIVENLDSKTPEGVFKRKSLYIAKVTNKPNTFAVLDENQNWIDFKWYETEPELSENHCRLYFYILENFLIENNREMKRYIQTTNLYK